MELELLKKLITRIFLYSTFPQLYTNTFNNYGIKTKKDIYLCEPEKLHELGSNLVTDLMDYATDQNIKWGTLRDTNEIDQIDAIVHPQNK